MSVQVPGPSFASETAEVPFVTFTSALTVFVPSSASVHGVAEMEETPLSENSCGPVVLSRPSPARTSGRFVATLSAASPARPTNSSVASPFEPPPRTSE